MLRRDVRDSTRVSSPAVQAADACVIDTTALTADEVVEQVCSIIKRKGQKAG
jgi:cytidylate kinase